MSGKKSKVNRKAKEQDAKFNLLVSMMIFQDDELFAELSDLQRKKKEGVINEETVTEGVRIITEKIMKKLEGKNEKDQNRKLQN